MSSVYTVIAILFALLLQLRVEALLAVSSWRMQIIPLLLLLLLLLLLHLLLLLLLLLIVILAVGTLMLLLLLLRDLLRYRLEVENFRTVAKVARLVSHRRPIDSTICVHVTAVAGHLMLLFRLVGHAAAATTIRLGFGKQPLLLRKAGSAVVAIVRR
jgi:hypothetical protein